jgi:hypothetical protein
LNELDKRLIGVNLFIPPITQYRSFTVKEAKMLSIFKLCDIYFSILFPLCIIALLKKIFLSSVLDSRGMRLLCLRDRVVETLRYYT